MAIEKYSVTLEEEIVKRAKEIAKPYGGQLSPIINNLLKEWVIKERKKLKEESNKKTK